MKSNPYRIQRQWSYLLAGLCLIWAQSSQAQISLDFDLPPRSQVYEAPSLENHLALEQGFSEWFESDDSRSLRQLGFLQETQAPVSMMHDPDRGWGAYFWNSKAKRNWMIQAPHQYFDRKTGAIALNLFGNSEARLLALNTAQRKVSQYADLARGRFSPFNALTRAALATFAPSLVIQIHGFNASKRETERARNAQVILSNGSGWMDLGLQNVAQCLGARWHTLRYPADTRELGATTNRQGQIMRELGHANFLHIELSFDVRKHMLTHPEDVVFLTQCLDQHSLQ